MMMNSWASTTCVELGESSESSTAKLVPSVTRQGKEIEFRSADTGVFMESFTFELELVIFVVVELEVELYEEG
jgi:hypothetical protein